MKNSDRDYLNSPDNKNYSTTSGNGAKEAAIEAYKGNEPYIFISYAHEDTALVMEFLGELKDNCRFWYDEGIPSGSDWTNDISERILNCALFLVFISDSSVKSENVKNEIVFASKYVGKIICIHLTEVKLPSSLELMLCRFQYIDSHKNGFAAAVDKLREYLPPEVRTASGKNDLPKAKRKTEFADDKADFVDYYDVKEKLSEGNMGEVLYVRQRRTGANYIAKHRIFGNTDKTIIRAAARNELRNLIRLQGKPYTPEIVDFFENEKESYVVMSRIQGLTLENLLRETEFKLTFKCAISLIYETALVLHDMHRMDLVYCDLKPSNIMLDQYGRINLVDFDTTSTTDERNTIPMATKKYAPPEQQSREYSTPDVRFDVYSLGVVLNELMQLLDNSGNKPAGDESRLNAFIDEIQRKMTHAQPRNRYGSMGEVIAVLGLLMDWNPEETLREVALSFIQPGKMEFEKRRTYPLDITDVGVILPESNKGPAIKFIPNEYDTCILEFSPDFNF
ncbi:MAG: TIR domain-containing protein [Lachnospiraceae bacterium]|nr:TIR domain-containing protein [Lachnospiraceae bacterium]